MKSKITILAIALFLMGGDKVLSQKYITNTKDNTPTYTPYIYQWGQEFQSPVADIILHCNTNVNIDSLNVSIPFLKYNKSWLFMLTQDDCKQAAFSATWAAINGKPLVAENYVIDSQSHHFYYNIQQLMAGDIPPGASYLAGRAGNALGFTDGCGNNLRFNFTTTVSAESDYMNASVNVNPGYTNNYYRFYMKSGLVWANVLEMMNYGNSIAFHDVAATDVHDTNDLFNHYIIAQDSIKLHTLNRTCKVLAEPNGNIDYYKAALNYDTIEVMTAQGNAHTLLYPFSVTDLHKDFVKRYFLAPEEIKTKVLNELAKPKEEREAVHIGVHGTDSTWAALFLWLNDNYGKDGDDSMWFTSFEEYYEYNYYRIHSQITKTQINDSTIKITVTLPSRYGHFYYPSLTLNVSGVQQSEISSITTNDTVKGFSYGPYAQGIMMNVNCRKFLYENAQHYTEQYLQNSDTSNYADALYFVSQLKDTPEKQTLLNSINCKYTLGGYDTVITATVCTGEAFTLFGFNADTTGTYVQNLQTVEGCDSIITLNLTCTNGLQSLQNSCNVSLYPNPAHNATKLYCEGINQKANVLLYDVSGREVAHYTLQAGQNNLKIDLKGFAKGVYTLRIEGEKQVIANRKLIVD